jgi:hypothetical protein
MFYKRLFSGICTVVVIIFVSLNNLGNMFRLPWNSFYNDSDLREMTQHTSSEFIGGWLTYRCYRSTLFRSNYRPVEDLCRHIGTLHKGSSFTRLSNTHKALL